MARLVVTEVLNPHNGLSVDLQFDRAPEGTLQVYVARMPRETGLPAASVQPVQGAANRYRVVHPYPQPVDRESELMYFTAVDDQGASVWEDEAGYLHGQAAAWIGCAAEDILTDIMKQLWRRIVDNRAGIEARLREIEPSVTLKQIIWGMGERIEAYPAIEINQVSFSEPYAAVPRVRAASVRADIYGYIVHQTPTVEAELITAFGRAVQRILNQEAYEEMTLLSGATLALCQAQDLAFDNNVWGGQALARFISSFSLSWTGETLETIR